MIISIVAVTDQERGTNVGERSKEFPMFLFTYGWPFHLIAVVFFKCQLISVLSIHLYFNEKKSSENDKSKINVKDDDFKNNRKITFAEKEHQEPKSKQNTRQKFENLTKTSQHSPNSKNNSNVSANLSKPSQIVLNKSKKEWQKIKIKINATLHNKEVIYGNAAVNERVCEKLCHHFKTLPQSTSLLAGKVSNNKAPNNNNISRKKDLVKL